MCKLKSAIILKDGIFMPNNYDSHTKMLEELKIDDTSLNYGTKFIRAEIYPESGDAFTDISTWQFHVDQDRTPKWFVPEYDEQRTRESLKIWASDEGRGYNSKKKLGEFGIGETFKIGNIEYIVLDKTEDRVSCITKNFINPRKRFDIETNNFGKSEVFCYLNQGEYYKFLANAIGEENIVEHEIDLMSSDGVRRCDNIKCKISLLTIEQYNKYRAILPAVENWWWLATQYQDYACGVCCASSYGGVGRGGYDYGGVRPFSILKSDIFVSCKS